MLFRSGGKQAAQPTFTAGQATKDTALTSVNTAKTLLSYLGHTSANTFSNTEYTMVTVKTNSATANRGERGTTTDFGQVPTYSFEEFEFI